MTYEEHELRNKAYNLLSFKQSLALKSRRAIQLTEEEVEMILKAMELGDA